MTTETKKKESPQQVRRQSNPLCAYCQKMAERQEKYFPKHDASDKCESGRHTHCTCEVCW